MRVETTLLSSGAKLTAYLPKNCAPACFGAARPAVLVLPGGGYAKLADYEGEPIALRYAARGYHAFVLEYRVAPHAYPAPQRDAAEAIRVLRTRADAFGVDPHRVAVTGFSAGGHLAACLGTMWREPDVIGGFGGEPADFRPDALILCYPVIDGGAFAHRGSFETLCGTPDLAAHARFSLQNRVDAQTPQTFLFHTSDDQSVPVQNSLLFAQALAAHGVPFSLHVFPHGRHGIATAEWQTAAPDKTRGCEDCAYWVPLALDWLDRAFGMPRG